MRATAILCAILLACAAPAGAAELEEEILGYMDFATETEGVILPAQLTEDVFAAVHFVDTRSAGMHGAGAIPGAVHIDWREVPGRLDELPESGMVVLYCQTGVLSAQSALAARLLGRSNVLVLQGGYQGWLRDAGWKPE